jgi:HPt (histidine-containing phosphotransfer) domain-containing protein
VHDKGGGEVTLEHVRLLIHRLSGTAGSFGADSLSDTAKEAETAVSAFIETGEIPDMAG